MASSVEIQNILVCSASNRVEKNDCDDGQTSIERQALLEVEPFCVLIPFGGLTMVLVIAYCAAQLQRD